MIDKPLYGNPLAGGLESSFNLLQRPVENIERQYFYNSDLNKLFNMPGGVRMAAPKGFESVNKNQYEDFASKGATLQGADMFNDAMGGGYNLNLPRLTSGPNSGQVDRNSPEFLYYYGDQQQQKLPPKLSLGSTMPSQEDGILGASGSNIPLNNDPFNLGSLEIGVNPIVSGNEYEIASEQGVGQDIFENNPAVTAVPSTPNPIQGMGFDQFGDLNSRLNKLEEGIGSLLKQNTGYNFNSMQPSFGAPNYGYSPFSMTGLGSLFGGYYG